MAALDVLTLVQAKEHLNLPVDQAQHNAELTRFIEAVVPAVERRIREYLYPRPAIERRYAAGGVIVLSGVPVASLTSITPVGGAAYNVADFDVDAERGVISAVSGVAIHGRFDIAYQVGHATVPPDIRLAVAIIVGEMWSKTQRRPVGVRGAGAQQELEVVAKGLFPSAALQLLPDPVPTVG